MNWWKSIRHKFQAARSLSLRDWLAVAGAWWVLLGFFVALRLVSLKRLERFTRPKTGRIAVGPDILRWAWQRESLIRMASRLHLLRMTCLPRALTLRWMLSRHGMQSQLCIGVNKTKTDFHAHAWVQMEAENIGEPEDIEERFVVLEKM
jgi:hypothetical protein